MQIRPKDFIETRHGFAFAIVGFELTEERVPGCLRYRRTANGCWHKLDTRSANAALNKLAPEYLYHSPLIDTLIHAVPATEVTRYYHADRRLAELLAQQSDDPLLEAAARIACELQLPHEALGITGSLLLGAHNQRSDIDIVVYGRRAFATARAEVQRLCRAGTFAELGVAHWRRAYQRRGCALDFDSYLFHEQRKGNKFLFDERKVDISLVPLAAERCDENGPYRKLGSTCLTARVIDDTYAFDFPARYAIDDPQIREVQVFTATYVGQAFNGEQIEAAGAVEEDAGGVRRLIVGSDREAAGQYLKLAAA